MDLRSFQNRSPLVIVQLAVIVFLVGAYMGVVTGQEKKDSDGPVTVSAQKFILVDQKGNERGYWMVDDERVSLGFTDGNGNVWVNIWAVMRNDGVAYLSIGDSHNKLSHSVALSSTESGAGVSVFDQWIPGTTENHAKATFKVWKGTPTLELKNPAKKPQVKLSADDNGPKFEMYDKKGDVSWRAPQKKNELRGL